MCHLHETRHGHCNCRVSISTMRTYTGLMRCTDLLDGNTPCCGDALDGGIGPQRYEGLPCCSKCHGKRAADVTSHLKYVEWVIKQGVKDKKYGFKRRMAEAKGESYWHLKLLDTPVRVSRWDGKWVKAFRIEV